MPLSQGYADYVLELLEGFAPLEVKRMFGAGGLYKDGLMFGVLDDDALYFRVDDALEAELKAQGSTPWSYSMKRDGTTRDMGYWKMPDTAADDPEEALALARRSYAAATARAGKRKPGKVRK
jgi:DNA transformation protein